ncbi:hypothetical protein ACRRTK_005445 [Alexandromys fortis]
MEDAGNKELSSTREPREVDCLMSSQLSTSFAKPPAKKKRANKTAKRTIVNQTRKQEMLRLQNPLLGKYQFLLYRIISPQ